MPGNILSRLLHSSIFFLNDFSTQRKHYITRESLFLCPFQQEHDLDFKDHGIMIVGCGPYHIGELYSFLPNHPLIFFVCFHFTPIHSCIVFISFNEKLVQKWVRAVFRSTAP